MNRYVLAIIRAALELDIPQPLRESIESLLVAGPLSGSDVALILRKRKSTVHRTLRQMAATNRIVRNAKTRKWELCPKQR
jgi:predicted transcriptional regulator